MRYLQERERYNFEEETEETKSSPEEPVLRLAEGFIRAALRSLAESQLDHRSREQRAIISLRARRPTFRSPCDNIISRHQLPRQAITRWDPQASPVRGLRQSDLVPSEINYNSATLSPSAARRTARFVTVESSLLDPIERNYEISENRANYRGRGEGGDSRIAELLRYKAAALSGRKVGMEGGSGRCRGGKGIEGSGHPVIYICSACNRYY